MINRIPKYNQSANPIKLYDSFSKEIKSLVAQKRTIRPMSFSCKLHDIGDVFISQHKESDLVKKAKIHAQMLVGMGQHSLAGIIYSFLIKLNKSNPKDLEEILFNALAIAKRQHDPVHIMARANNLRLFYAKTKPESPEYLKFLYEEKRALVDICKKYEGSNKRFKTITTEMKSIASYEKMLASIKIEIARNILKKNPKLAKEELLSAQSLLLKYGKGKGSQEIEELLKNI
jgi:hypothetical protein